MPDIPATNVDTSGVYGQSGVIPLGTQVTSGANFDSTGTGSGAYGSTTARPNPPGVTGTLDTEGVYGPNQPGSFTPVSTLLGGTKDTTQGFAGNVSAPVYRAPGATTPGTIKDTTNAQGFTAAIPVDTYAWITTGTSETANFGAPGGQVISQTDTITANTTTGTALSKTGILSTAAQLVVKKGVTTLTVTTDYTVTTTGANNTRTYTIVAVDSATVDPGDTLTVQYLYGDTLYFASHDPTAVPPAPVIGTAVAGDRKAKVVWTNPALAITDDIDGYLIRSDTGGTRYVPGGQLSFFFETLVPGQPYKFQVAAFNEKGLGPFSSLSNAVTPLNYDEVPTGSLDPKNTVNPVYNIDGSIVPGTGLGV